MNSIWIVIILGIGLIIFLSGCKKLPINPQPDPDPEPPVPPVPIPDPVFYKWQKTDTTTQRWADYLEYMKKITSDTLLAAEMRKKVLIDGILKYFYRWVSDWDLFNKLDHWDLADEVWARGTADCDGFARLTCDVLGRILKILKVSWVEHYGFYREYIYDPKTGEYSYKVVVGGHAIAVYEKDGALLAFSNISWWSTQNFKNYLDICEKTFPEGIYLIRCRHWETGILQWVDEAPEGEILEGTNIFHRRLRLIRNLQYLRRGEQKKIVEQLNN